MIDGIVGKTPETRRTPAGISITRFTLLHQSTRSEGGLTRQASCRIGVVFSGADLKAVAPGLAEGSKVRVTGFLSRSSHRDELNRLVVHAERIEPLNEQMF